MKNRPKVVFDTNIFINGIFFPQEHVFCSKIIDLINLRKFQLLFAQDTIGELVYNTKRYSRHIFGNAQDTIIELKWLMELFYYATTVNSSSTAVTILNDPGDEMFLKCAIIGNADFLVSDDLKSGLHNNNGKNKLQIKNSEDFEKLFDSELQKEAI